MTGGLTVCPAPPRFLTAEKAAAVVEAVVEDAVFCPSACRAAYTSPTSFQRRGDNSKDRRVKIHYHRSPLAQLSRRNAGLIPGALVVFHGWIARLCPVRRVTRCLC